MDVVMMFVTFLLLATFRTFNCSFPSAHASKLFFRLLQTDDQASEDKRDHNSEGRRPFPSDLLPIEDLMENESDIYDPRPRDINNKLLRKQLGKMFDRKYMSIRDPARRRDSSKLIPLKKGRPKSRRPNYLGLFRTARLQDGRRLRLNVSRKNRRKFQKYLWSLTFCPVKSSWKYLGKRFWPQWIKEGKCVSEHSCSVPPGMTCKPKGSTTKTLLRWHCENFKDRSFCQWIPVEYPLITECSCSC